MEIRLNLIIRSFSIKKKDKMFTHKSNLLMPLEYVSWDHLEKINGLVIFLIMYKVHKGKKNTCQNCMLQYPIYI